MFKIRLHSRLRRKDFLRSAGFITMFSGIFALNYLVLSAYVSVPWFAMVDIAIAQAHNSGSALGFSTLMSKGRPATLREVAEDSEGNLVVTGHGNFRRDQFAGIPTYVYGSIDNSTVLVAKFNQNASALIWVALIGGSKGLQETNGKDRGYGLSLDVQNNIYVAGRTSSIDFPTTQGAFDQTYNGGEYNPVHGAQDAFALKLSADGSRLIYSTYLGGSRNDGARGGVVVDARGHAYVFGTTSSRDFLGQSVPHVNKFVGGDSDAFLTKLSTDGAHVLYNRFVGGADGPEDHYEEVIVGAAVDQNYQVYAAAILRSAGAISTDGSIFRGGDGDLYLMKISADGKELIYGTILGGAGDDGGSDRVALGNDGSIYVTGGSASSDFPIRQADQPTHGGKEDGILVKLDPEGKIIFSTFVGGSEVDVAYGPALDEMGNVYVTGRTQSLDFHTSPDAYDKSYNGGSFDGFLRIYDISGRLKFSTFIGGMDRDVGRYVVTTHDGYPILLGETNSPDFPTTPGAYQVEFPREQSNFRRMWLKLLGRWEEIRNEDVFMMKFIYPKEQ